MLPYSCKSGVCRTCRGRVLHGKVDLGNVHEHYLPLEHRKAGYALLCQARALSDIVVEVEEISADRIKPRVVPCRVKTIGRPAADVAILDVRLPMNENLQFAAGQYVEFILPGAKRRSYSIATPPEPAGVIDLTFHIRHIAGGHFTEQLFSGGVKAREILRFEGPLGSFFLREESAKPVVLVASGTGFAPIHAVLESAFRKGIQLRRPMTLYWGCRRREDLYLFDVPLRWAREYANFDFVPVLSEAGKDWTGRRGLVHRAVMEDFAELSAFQVYACGAPVMVEAARRDFTQLRGLAEQEFFADSFVTEAERAAAPRAMS